MARPSQCQAATSKRRKCKTEEPESAPGSPSSTSTDAELLIGQGRSMSKMDHYTPSSSAAASVSNVSHSSPSSVSDASYFSTTHSTAHTDPGLLQPQAEPWHRGRTSIMTNDSPYISQAHGSPWAHFDYTPPTQSHFTSSHGYDAGQVDVYIAPRRVRPPVLSSVDPRQLHRTVLEQFAPASAAETVTKPESFSLEPEATHYFDRDPHSMNLFSAPSYYNDAAGMNGANYFGGSYSPEQMVDSYMHSLPHRERRRANRSASKRSAEDAPVESSPSKKSVQVMKRSKSQPAERQSRQRQSLDKPKFVCEICHYQFARRHNYNNHKETHRLHRPRDWKCDEKGCVKDFRRAADLQRHKNTVHCREKQFFCEDCNTRFPRKDSLQRHLSHGCARRDLLYRRRERRLLDASKKPDDNGDKTKGRPWLKVRAMLDDEDEDEDEDDFGENVQDDDETEEKIRFLRKAMQDDAV